jgi:iron complex outermembrane recepter protein
LQTHRQYTTSLLIALLMLAATTANAQQTQKASGVSKNSGLLEEIVVTARKKSESLQETPLSITALSAEQLQRAGATNNYDVALLTPNFSTNQQLGRRLDRPVIRGQSGAAVGGEPNASYFIDGVFVSGSISSATLGPVERVEIIRGPQSAQFGRATFAGAVNYITRAPTNEFEGEVRVIRATNDTKQLTAWTSGPIIEDKLQYFVAGSYDTYGGEWYNSLGANQAPTSAFINPPQNADNSKLGGTETKDFTGKLLWAATDTTDVTLKLGLTKNKDDHYAQLILEPGELNCYLPTAANANQPWYNTSQGAYCGEIDFNQVTYNDSNPFAGPYIPGAPLNGDSRQSRFNLPDFRQGMSFINTTDPSFNGQPVRPGSDREQKRSLLQIDQGLGEWDLVARAAYNTDVFKTAYDLDQRETRPLGGVFTNVEERDLKDKSFELILSSPADRRLRGSIGTYLFESELQQKQRRLVGFSCFGPGCGLAEFEDPLVTNIENRSVFGSIDFDISQSLTFSAEARYAKDKKTIESSYSCTDATSPFNGQAVDDAVDSDALTPRFILKWQATASRQILVIHCKLAKTASPKRRKRKPGLTKAARKQLGWMAGRW